MVRAWHGHGMASVNQTRPHCVNQMGKTHSKRLAGRHGKGTAWARHGHGMAIRGQYLVLWSTLKATSSHETLNCFPVPWHGPFQIEFVKEVSVF